MTRVKICGLTNLEDALVAAGAGADYLGFILWPNSKRAADPAAVPGIVRQLRQRPGCPLLVGVFVNSSAEEIASTLAEFDLDLAQLHGDEVPAMIGDPSSPIYGRAYKAIRPTSLEEAEADAEWYTPPERHLDIPALMVDTYHPALRGGTGETTDWEMAARLAASVPGFMLAGGLTPANVAGAVSQVKPFAVDVASGVELSPGKKDHNAVQAFVEAVRDN